MGGLAPPHDHQAEASCLGAILLRNEAIHQVDTLTPEDFYSPQHRAVFAAMRELDSKSQPIDPVTVEARLVAAGLAEGGILSMLSDLVDAVHTADNISHYAAIVSGKAAIRRVMLAASEISHAGYAADSPEEYLERAERTIQAASDGRKTGGPQPLAQVLKTALRSLDRRSNASGVTGIPSGYEGLDALTGGLQPSDLIILGARPSMGKTALALCLAANASLGGGAPSIIFSLEMSAGQLGERLMFSEARVDGSQVRMGNVTRADMVALTTAGNRLTDAPIRVDDTPALGPTEVRARCRRWRSDRTLFKDGKPGLIVVDYLQLMRIKGMGKNSNREQEISEISRSLKAIAKEMECPVLALSQLNRGLEARADKRPIMSDLRESGAIEQDADIILFLYRDEVYNANSPNKGQAELEIAKHRNGPTGKVFLRYHSSFTRFDSTYTNGANF